MSRGTLFVITAPSGAGKTTLINRLLRSLDNLEFSVSYATRAKRKGEIDGKDYHFVSKEAFRKMQRAGGFLEWARVFDDYYGTPKKKTEELLKKGKDIILDIDVQGASQIRRKMKGAVFIFILPPDCRTLRERLERRKSDSKTAIRKRVETAKKDVREFDAFDYIVVNDRIGRAFEELKGIFLAERARICRSYTTARRIVNTFR